MEVEDQPGLSLMALWLPGATISHLRLHQEHIELLDDPALWHDIHPIAPADVNAWLIFAEPFRIDAQAVICGLQRLYPETTIMGGIASGMVAERTSCVFFDGQYYEEGAVALGIGGPYSIDPEVSQGCEPIGESWTITEVERNLVITISNRPALEVLQETVTRLPAEQREMAQNNLAVGLAVNEYHDRFERGDFVVRGILGIDPRRGSIAVGGMPRVGQTLQFQLRDAVSANTDLHRTLERLGALSTAGTPVAAVLCTCDGRGEALFGEQHHDAAAVNSNLGGVPLVGGFFLGEIGPLGDQAVLHSFTAMLGVIRFNPVPATG
jgi:small ligand-binding sensory domain FIST